MRQSIVTCRSLRTHNRHRHRKRIDRLVTVRHVEDHIREVGVGVGEHLTSQTHVSCTGIRLRCRSRTVEREVPSSVKRTADGHIITVHTVCLTVIVIGAMMTRNRHNNLIQCRNGLITILHLEGHRAEVIVRIMELVCSKTHVRRTLNGSLRHSRTTEGKVSRGVKVIAERNIVTAHAVFITIVGSHIMMTRNRHRHVDRVDRHLTVGNAEVHRAKVAVRVSEQALGQVHVGRTDIRTRCCSRTCELDVMIHIVQHILASCRVTRRCVRLTVVRSRHRITRDRHRHVNRVDRHLTVGHLEGHRAEVAVRVGELVCGEAHIGRTGIRSRCRGRTAEGEAIVDIVQGIRTSSRVACRSVRLAVVRCRLSVTRDGHRHIDRINSH